MHLAHNSAKLKIFNLPNTIQLLRFGLSASTGPSRAPPPAIRWSVGLCPTDQRSDVGSDTKRRLDLAEPPYRQRLRSSSLGLHAPLFSFFQVPRRQRRVLRFFQVVETRRLELLTLSLQRRCSAN